MFESINRISDLAADTSSSAAFVEALASACGYDLTPGLESRASRRVLAVLLHEDLGRAPNVDSWDHRSVFRHPAAFASVSEQNQHSSRQQHITGSGMQ